MKGEHRAEEGTGIECTAIVVGEKPLVIYDWGDHRWQTRFLDGLDPDFFRYLAVTHEAQLGGDHDAQAAVAPRLAYSHALETLFALIAAAIQAPHCPAGWILNYYVGDLRALVSSITRREKVISSWLPKHADWRLVAETLIPWLPDSDEPDALRAASARLWASLARDLNDDNLHDEYNGLKHGFRVRSGEWFLRIGPEETRGVAPPPEKMRVMGSGRYGSDFLRSVHVAERQKVLEEQRVNWNPAVLSKRIPLIADSIQNVVNFLKASGGVPGADPDFRLFTDEDVVESLRDPSLAGVTRWRTRPGIPVESLPSFTREEILAWYLEK